MKYSIKEVAHLLEKHSDKNDTLDSIICDNLSGSGTKAAARMMYTRLLILSTDAPEGSNQYWKLFPKGGLTRSDNVGKYIKDESSYGLNSSHMLRYFSQSTYAKVFRMFFNTGLLKVDMFNKMWLQYPVKDKMLSLVNAAKAIKSSYKKQKTKTEDIEPEEYNQDFWDKY